LQDVFEILPCSRRIESDLSVFYLFAEVPIRNSITGDHVYFAPEDVYQCVVEGVQVADVIVESVWLELDANIDIAVYRVEVVADGGAEDGEATHVVGAAEFDDFGLFGGDERLHRRLPSAASLAKKGLAGGRK